MKTYPNRRVNPRPELTRLVTVYRLDYPGMTEVQQFYEHRYDTESGPIYVTDCPGCGRSLGYGAVGHRCTGRLYPEPARAKHHLGMSRAQADAELREYVASLDHTVHVSD